MPLPPPPDQAIGASLPGATSETFFDPAIGKRRGRSEPLKTQLEAAEASPTVAAAAGAVPPKAPPAIRPLAEVCRRRHKSLGTIPYAAVESVVEAEMQHELKTILKAMPTTAEAITGLIEQRDMIDQKIASSISTAADLVGRLRDAILARADTRRQTAQTRANLAESEATLANPESLKLSDNELVRLSQNVKLLPAVVLDQGQRINALTDEIGRLSVDAGVPASGFIAFLLVDGPDQHILGLNRLGFLA